MMMHDYKRALYDFSAAILNETRYSNKQPLSQNKTENSLALFYLHGGQCNYYLGQFEEALAHYKIAEQRDRSDKDREGKLIHKIAYNKGLAYASLMQYEKAIEEQKIAIEKDPDP